MKFGLNTRIHESVMCTNFGDPWKCLVMWPKCYRLKMGRKWTILNRYIAINRLQILMKNELCFLSTLATAFFRELCSFIPTWILFFFFFYCFFLVLLQLSTFELLNALYSKFQWLKILGRTCVRLKSHVPGWGDPTKSGPPKFWTLKSLQLDESNFRSG